MRILKGLTLVVLVAGAVAYWVGSSSKRGSDIGQAPGLSGESEAREPVDFTLADRKGRQTKLSSLRGKAILLNFWATWCPPCLEELPSLLRFAQWAKGNLGVEVVAVSVDQSWDQIDKFLAEKKLWPRSELPLTILLSSDAKVAADYGSSKFPETYFIDRNFKIVRKFVGVQDWMSQEIIKWVTDHSR